MRNARDKERDSKRETERERKRERERLEWRDGQQLSHKLRWTVSERAGSVIDLNTPSQMSTRGGGGNPGFSMLNR